MDQNQMDFDTGADKLCEECGVFGIHDFNGNNVASAIYYGLFALQYRGQESCGTVVSDTQGPKGKVGTHKGMGPCNEVFTTEILEQIYGSIGVGHVRYFMVGSSTRENAQPLVLNYIKDTLALVHNGNLVNVPQLCHELEYTGAIFQTITDSEVIAYHIARARVNTPSVENTVFLATKKLKGAYSLVIMSPRKLIGAKDPFGFKSPCIGKRDNAYILAPETCALDTTGVEPVRDVEPGEIVTTTKDGTVSDREMCSKDPAREARCTFEYTYSTRPDSVFDGMSVYHARIQAGRSLAMDAPVEVDLVVGVPESGNGAVLGYFMEPGVLYRTAFAKNSYVGRAFIKPKQSSWESAAHIKLNVPREAVARKWAIMIDDSIVRDTTSALIVNMFRDAGAIQVHMRISVPPFLHLCYPGTDIPSEDQPIAHGHTADEIRRIIGADSLSFLQTERLHEMAVRKPVCMACFDGVYSIEPPPVDIGGTYGK